MMQEPSFVFLDLETTGLSPDNDRILEIGMVITDDNLNMLATFGECIQWNEIYYHVGTDSYNPPFGIHEKVVEMHEKNGLWEDCYRSKKDAATVWNDAITFIQHQLGNVAQDIYMVGNTIGFDRSFLHHWVPGFNELFNYRSVDISSIKVLYKKWISDGIDPSKPANNGLHRAVPDCLDSIQELRYYQHVLFDKA